jgi:hypothetical protein
MRGHFGLHSLLILSTLFVFGSPARAVQGDPSDEEVLAAFDALAPVDQSGVVDYLRLDLSHQDRFQLTLTRYALTKTDRDPGFWPEPGPLRFYDPETYAPAQPIPRRTLDPESSQVTKLTDRMKRFIPKRRLQLGYVYDWATGDVHRLEGADDPRRIVENALQGFNPDLDLAEALLLRALDDGSQRDVFDAFSRRYTDRTGALYPTLSLYDAWASGVEMEMPDIDVLGLVHALVPERERGKRWVAPIPTSQHDELYGKLGEYYVPAKQFRSLREALVRSYLIAQPVMRDGFGPTNVDVFHAFWDVHGSEVEQARAELPEPGKKWTKFLSDWVKRLGKEEDLLARMRTRSATLAADEAFVRTRLVAVMRDMGVL